MPKIQDDRRVDPRLKALFAMVPVVPETDVGCRQELLDEENQPAAIAQREQIAAMSEILDDHLNAPADGLDISTVEFTSQPDGNTIKLQVIRPDTGRPAALRVLHPRRRDAERCRASTACTGRGAGSSPTRASPS